MPSRFINRISATALAVLAFTLLAAVLVAGLGKPASARSASHDQDFSFQRAIVGTWRVQVQQYNCQSNAPVGPAFPSFLTFGEGGTLVEGTTNPAFAPGQRAVGYGVWSVEGRRKYSAKSTAFIQFTTPAVPPANPGFTAGTQTIGQETREFRSRTPSPAMPPSPSRIPLGLCIGRAVQTLPLRAMNDLGAASLIQRLDVALGFSRRGGDLAAASLLDRAKAQSQSSAVAGIDADVFRGEVASPVTGGRVARVQVHDDGNVFGEQPVAGGALVEIERLAAAQNGNAGHLDVDAARDRTLLRSGPRRRKCGPNWDRRRRTQFSPAEKSRWFPRCVAPRLRSLRRALRFRSRAARLRRRRRFAARGSGKLLRARR